MLDLYLFKKTQKTTVIEFVLLYKAKVYSSRIGKVNFCSENTIFIYLVNYLSRGGTI